MRIGLPQVGDLIVMGEERKVAVVVNRIDGKRGSRFSLVTGGPGYSQKIDVRPLTRVPADWKWLPSKEAFLTLNEVMD